MLTLMEGLIISQLMELIGQIGKTNDQLYQLLAICLTLQPQR